MKPAKLFLMLFMAAAALSLKSQTLVNKLSETITGQSDTVPLAPIVKSGSNYVVAANQKVNATQNDFKTTSLSGNIVSVWQQLYNASNKKAFSTAITRDAAGNVYVAGSTYLNPQNGQDLTVIKYNANGQQQFVAHYNGPGNSYDVGSGIAVDNTGNIFVTGASVGQFPALVDYVTLKLNSSGAIQWTSRYNFANGIDIPVGIVLDNSGNVIVSGSSASSMQSNNWDFATVKYNKNSGSQMAVQRQSNTGTAQDKVMAQTKDSQGNIYTTGVTSSDGVNYNVQTIKYDPNMNPLWVQVYDGFGFWDQGSTIAVDNLGNVIVGGYTTKPDLRKALLVLSYSGTGNLNWSAKKQPEENVHDAEGVKVFIKSNKEIFIGGNYTVSANSDMAILRYNEFGTLTLEKTYNGPAGLNDRLLDLLVDGNNIIVSGQTSNGSINQNVTIKYEYRDHPIVVSLHPSGVKYDSTQVIVDFNKAALKMSAINNRDFMFGKLSDFVADTTCAKITAMIPNAAAYGINALNFDTRKIFLNFTEGDSISLTRYGEYVKMRKVYCYLLVSFPNPVNIFQIADTLRYIKPDINYGQVNHISEADFIPNDPLYPGQASLHPTISYPNAHINMQPAWDYTKGKRYIRVGVFDTGIDYSHTELNSQVEGGWDYAQGVPMSTVAANSHGTGVAGIIGAKTNNNTGVSGIAGGNQAAQDSGVALYNMRIMNVTLVSDQIIANAMQNGAYGQVNNNPNPLRPLHIMSNSWSQPGTRNQFLCEGVHDANLMGVCFFASRGNEYSNTFNAALARKRRIPAGLYPGIVSSVGASGNDGHYHKIQAAGNIFFSSHFGDSLDFVAPGSYSIVTTTKGAYGDMPQANGYQVFGGTSSACPHAAGVAGLILSYRNAAATHTDNLMHEDVEELLKRSATDLNHQTPNLYYEAPGYDTMTGWGRINAAAALAKIEYPKYRIRHIYPNAPNVTHAAGNSIVDNLVQRYWPGVVFPGPGVKNVHIYERLTTLSYTLNPNEQIIGYWPLHTKSSGVPYYADTIWWDAPHHVEIVSVSNSQAQVKNYFYELLCCNIFYPSSAPLGGLSLYTYDSTAVIGVEEIEPDIQYFNLYPNPTTGKFTLGFRSNSFSAANITIYDITGRLVYTDQNAKVIYGVNRFVIDPKDLQTGVYFVNLDVGSNKRLTKKLLITR